MYVLPATALLAMFHTVKLRPVSVKTPAALISYRSQLAELQVSLDCAAIPPPGVLRIAAGVVA